MPEKPAEPKHTPFIAAKISDNFYQFNMLKQDLKRRDCERKKKQKEDKERNECTFSPDIRTLRQEQAESRAEVTSSRMQNEAIKREISLL
jgi:hypothetical protein